MNIENKECFYYHNEDTCVFYFGFVVWCNHLVINSKKHETQQGKNYMHGHNNVITFQIRTEHYKGE